jgi:hypothetical protein
MGSRSSSQRGGAGEPEARGDSATAYWQSREAPAIPVPMRDCDREVTDWKPERPLSILSVGSRARARKVETRARSTAPYRPPAVLIQGGMTLGWLGDLRLGVVPIRALVGLLLLLAASHFLEKSRLRLVSRVVFRFRAVPRDGRRKLLNLSANT